jgi:hypothetical protein
VNEWKKRAHQLPVFLASRRNDKLFPLTGDLSAVTIANAAPSSESAYGIRFHSFKIINRQFLLVAKENAQQEHDWALAAN